jgi:hypothetical protein
LKKRLKAPDVDGLGKNKSHGSRDSVETQTWNLHEFLSVDWTRAPHVIHHNHIPSTISSALLIVVYSWVLFVIFF